MSDDLDLASAFRAAKEEYDGHSPDAELTLQRALFATRRDTRRRKVTQWVVIPVAAALAASTAWAGATGRLAPMMHSLSDAFHASDPAHAPTSTDAPLVQATTPPGDAPVGNTNSPANTPEDLVASADGNAPPGSTIRAGADPAAAASTGGNVSAPPKNGAADSNAARNATSIASTSTRAGADPTSTRAGADPTSVRAGADPTSTRAGADPTSIRAGGNPNSFRTGADSFAAASTGRNGSAPPKHGVASADANAARNATSPSGSAIRAGADPTAPTSTPSRAAATVDAGAPASAASIREQQLFAEANRIHFVERDAARALAAWNRYLAEAPNGVLAPEARYNRALTLVRLGRTVEARTELQPFANGTYRAAEARALLDAIARDAGAP